MTSERSILLKSCIYEYLYMVHNVIKTQPKYPTAKYNESEEDLPDLQTLEDITEQSISNETVLNYELWALKKMGWKLNAHTPLAFIACYVVCGVANLTDTCRYAKGFLKLIQINS